MEYPTLFTAGTRWLVPRPRTSPKSVTVHEAGHQFWYGIVATNEFEHAWMDEGHQHVLDRARDRAAVHADLLREAVFRRLRAVDVPRLSAQPRSATAIGWRRTGRRRRPTRRRRRRWRYWPGTAGVDHLRQDRAVAAHARTHARLGDAAAHPVDVLFALGVPASQARGLLRRRERSERTGSDLVLRSGLSQLQRLRLRRRRASERAGSGARVFGDEQRSGAPHARTRQAPFRTTRRRPPLRRRHVSRSTSASSSRTRRKCAGAGTGAIAGRCSRSTSRCAPRSSRSIPITCCCST